MPSELIVRNLSAGYGDLQVLHDLNLTLKSGDRLGIIGRNGAGKTTSLAAIMGLARQFSGALDLNGQSIAPLPTFKRSRAGIGYVPQTRDVFHGLTVEENLLSALNGHAAVPQLEMAYKMFPRLRERKTNRGGQLSGGEQQMLAVARALVGKPELLLLDEPLEGLAPQIRDELMDAIILMTEATGVGCILIEQNVDVVLDFADNLIVLESGKTVYSGSSSGLAARPEILEQSIGIGKVA